MNTDIDSYVNGPRHPSFDVLRSPRWWRFWRRHHFTTTPSKIALEHQDEVRDLTAQGIAAVRGKGK